MKKIVKKNYKILIGIVIGIIVSTTIVYSAENILTGGDISYDNKTSGEKTVQGAIDELYKKANSCKEYIPNDNPNRNIVKVYKYDENSESNTYCVTGDEQSCFITSCYDNKAKDSCPPGTIIEYMVSSDTKVRFHVVHDDGNKMTLQTQKNTISSVQWHIENTFEHGPETALTALEEKTNNWTNVNNLEYSIGDDKSTLGYSGCDNNLNCSSNPYTLNKKGVKARMITVQEAKNADCRLGANSSCPQWMYNYCYASTDYNGTANETGIQGYWTMSSIILSDFKMNHAYNVGYGGGVYYSDEIVSTRFGIRPVVEINK